MVTNITNEKKLVYPELSYILMGILFEVHNKLGTKYQEKHYQRAIEIKLKELNIPYKREVKVNVEFGKENLGEFFIDFIIKNKIIL
jgi:GxxExxY protein